MLEAANVVVRGKSFGCVPAEAIRLMYVDPAICGVYIRRQIISETTTMFTSLKRITYQVGDIARAREWYTVLLGKTPVFDSPFAVMYAVGETLLILSPAGDAAGAGDDRVVAAWGVEDIDGAYQRLKELGAEPCTEITAFADSRSARLRDPFGNVIGITCKVAAGAKESAANRPSESAMTVMLCRALAALDEREAMRGADHLAEIFLHADARAALKEQATREWTIQNMVTPPLHGYFRARTIWLDEAFRQALRDNTPQIVFIGAGYDTRAIRFREELRASRVFEVDFPATQQRKAERLRQAGIDVPARLTFVPIDGENHSFHEKLRAAGFDEKARTLFIWEGVMYYMTADAVDRTLETVGAHAPAGSEICFDVMTEMRPSVYAAEPFRFSLAEPEIEPFLKQRGFAVVERWSPERIEKRFLTSRDGTPTGKSLPYFAFVRASICR